MDSVGEGHLDSKGVQTSHSLEVEQSANIYQREGQDEAMKAFQDREEVVIVDEATNRRLLKRIDLILMPVSTFFSLNGILRTKVTKHLIGIDVMHRLWTQFLGQ